ncbi:hypothetical protein QYF36_000124 [Acer negundo]|nr:hypothetical protein QYF36_000124 [Acer negundo]
MVVVDGGDGETSKLKSRECFEDDDDKATSRKNGASVDESFEIKWDTHFAAAAIGGKAASYVVG